LLVASASSASFGELVVATARLHAPPLPLLGANTIELAGLFLGAAVGALIGVATQLVGRALRAAHASPPLVTAAGDGDGAGDAAAEPAPADAAARAALASAPTEVVHAAASGGCVTVKPRKRCTVRHELWRRNKQLRVEQRVERAARRVRREAKRRVREAKQAEGAAQPRRGGGAARRLGDGGCRTLANGRRPREPDGGTNEPDRRRSRRGAGAGGGGDGGARGSGAPGGGGGRSGGGRGDGGRHDGRDDDDEGRRRRPPDERAAPSSGEAETAPARALQVVAAPLVHLLRERLANRMLDANLAVM
jgi:uncharacterized membrane protein YgcG